jgi:2'-5' RNA ligase
MRLFVALEVGEPALSGVLGLQERLRQAITRQGVRFTRRERLHLTLSFLGNVDESRLDELKAALLASTTPPRP